jgi:hypothetical protein
MLFTSLFDSKQSLAVADLLVSVVVMPFGILNEFYGKSFVQLLTYSLNSNWTKGKIKTTEIVIFI